MLIIEGEIQKRKDALKEGTRKWREETRQVGEYLSFGKGYFAFYSKTYTVGLLYYTPR